MRTPSTWSHADCRVPDPVEQKSPRAFGATTPFPALAAAAFADPAGRVCVHATVLAPPAASAAACARTVAQSGVDCAAAVAAADLGAAAWAGVANRAPAAPTI